MTIPSPSKLAKSDVENEPESWWSHLPKAEIIACAIFASLGLVIWFGPITFADHAGIDGLIAGAFVGVIITEVVGCSDGVKNACRYNRLLAHATAQGKQISVLQRGADDEALPLIRSACELGSRLVDELASQWRSSADRAGILNATGRLGIEKDVARLLEKPPAPAQLSGEIYEALTNVVGSEVLASYRLGY
jgi:hypothetical protein